MSNALVVAAVTAIAGPILVGLLVRYLDQYTCPAALRRRILEDYALLEKLPDDDQARPYLEKIIHAHVWRYAYNHYVHRARDQLRPGFATVGVLAVAAVILGGGLLAFRAKEPELETTSLVAIEESVRRMEQWADYLLAFGLIVIGITIGGVTLIWWRYLHNLWNPSLPLDLPESVKPAKAEDVPAADPEAEEPPREVTDE